MKKMLVTIAATTLACVAVGSAAAAPGHADPKLFGSASVSDPRIWGPETSPRVYFGMTSSPRLFGGARVPIAVGKAAR